MNPQKLWDYAASLARRETSQSRPQHRYYICPCGVPTTSTVTIRGVTAHPCDDCWTTWPLDENGQLSI